MTAFSARARRPSLLLAMVTITAVLGADPARSQDFPTRPIRLIVGPSPDVFSRIIAEHLQQAWGQPVVVEPRPGAGGKLAAAAVAGAEPDGHTLLFATPTYTLNAAMKLASYDLVKEFEPVSIIGLISYALVVHPSVPARSVAELVALAKARPGALNCASAGIGTVPHLACETLNKSAGVNVVHVPYRDVNAAMMGTVGGTVQMFVAVSTVARAQILSGTVRGLAVTTAQRSTLLPDDGRIRLSQLRDAGMGRFSRAGAYAKRNRAEAQRRDEARGAQAG